MKIIEALKKSKDLLKKADDIRDKIKKYCAHMSHETPTYKEQKQQVSEWLQAHQDIVKEIERLKVCIQKTNLETLVKIEIAGKQIEKSIASWVLRRRDLADLDHSAWKCLTDKNLKEGVLRDSQGEKSEVKIVRCYDAAERDKKVEEYRSEPSIIDGILETTNAITDVIE